MAFNSELGSESTTSKDVCVCERGIGFSAYVVGLCFLWHVWMCTPYATSSESLLARKGIVEYTRIVWSDLVVLSSCNMWL